MPKSLKNFISCLLAVLLIGGSIFSVILLCVKHQAVSNQPKFVSGVESKDTTVTVVQNSNYKMELDLKNYGINLTNLTTNEVWATTPYDEESPQFDEFGIPISLPPQIESVIKVVYRNAQSRTDDVLLSYTDAVEEGTVISETTEKGFRVNFYFNTAEIMVPVEYELLEDSVRISVDPTQIQENDNRVIQVAIAPFLASAKNDLEDSYVFVPSGSGAIINSTTISADGNTFSAPVYGEDGSIEKEIDVSNVKEIRLPVFGAKNGNLATFAVIDGAPEAASIVSKTGASQFGYSTAYANFYVRGYTNHTATMFSSQEVKDTLYTVKAIEETISVTYFPLNNDDANYSGMARTYQEYLEKNEGLTQKEDDKVLSLTFIGGKTIIKSFLGIPYETISELTSISDAYEIVKKLDLESNGNIIIKLKGYGETGIDIGSVSGGFTLNSKLGNKSDLSELTTYLNNNGSQLYFDYDLVRFNSSKRGFAIRKSAVYNVGELKAVQYKYNIASKEKDENSAHYLLSPNLFDKASEMLIKQISGVNITGVSLDTLSSMSYSDYKKRDSAQYYSKVGMPAKTVNVFENITKSGKEVAAADANLYAAVLADVITDVPIESAKDYSFSYDIPFYSMVFKGYTPVFTESINLKSNPTHAFLKAIEGGMGIGYTVISEWNNSLIDAGDIELYNCVYGDLKNVMAQNYNVLSSYKKMISGAKIVSHEILDSGLRKSTFDNGIIVYVNYNDFSIATPEGNVSANNYLILEK